jgi:hypothetical protein
MISSPTEKKKKKKKKKKRREREILLFHIPSISLHIFFKSIVEFVGPTCGSYRSNGKFEKKMDGRWKGNMSQEEIKERILQGFHQQC